MLVLTRRAGESIVIGDEVRVVVLDVRGDTVRLGIEAPRSVPVHRAEVYAEVQAANAAAATPADLDSVAGRLRRLAKPTPRSGGRPSAQRASKPAPPGGSQPPQQPGPRRPGQPGHTGQPGQPGQHPTERRPQPPVKRPVPQPPHQRPGSGAVGEVSTGTAGASDEAHTPEDPNPTGNATSPAPRPGPPPGGRPERPVPRPPAHRPPPQQP